MARRMTPRPLVRRTGLQARRSRRVRRASAGLSPVRAGALLAMLVSVVTIYGAAATSFFGYRTMELDGGRYTSREAVDELVGVAQGTNLVGVETEVIAERLVGLPTVREASVSVALPDTLRVRLVEREPVLVWRVGERSFLVDGDGRVFGMVDPAAGSPELPIVTDRRAASIALAVGGQLEPVDLDAATRLGSLRPADLGSAAAALRFEVSDENGFVVAARPDGWTAIFGFYTPTLRRPEMIPGQVRLLRSLIAGREASVARVILASETDGTYIPRPSPEASP